MAPLFRVATLAVAYSLAVFAAAQGTVKPADTDAVKVVTPPPLGAPATGAAPASNVTQDAAPYVPAPIPEPSDDSPTFRKVPNGVCSDQVAQLIEKIYTKNRALFDVCADASKYQIFPFSGKLPTQEQIYALSTNKACTALFTACVLADLPQCDLSQLGLKSVVETLLKITVDIDNGKPTPDTMRFHYMHIWRRDSNLAQAAGVPFGNDSQLYKEYSANLWTALTKYNVHVLPDLSIEYNVDDLVSAMRGGATAMRAQTLSDHSSAGSSGAASSSSHEKDADIKPQPSTNATMPTPTTSASTVHRLSSVVVLCAAIIFGSTSV